MTAPSATVSCAWVTPAPGPAARSRSVKPNVPQSHSIAFSTSSYTRTGTTLAFGADWLTIIDASLIDDASGDSRERHRFPTFNMSDYWRSHTNTRSPAKMVRVALSTETS